MVPVSPAPAGHPTEGQPAGVLQAVEADPAALRHPSADLLRTAPTLGAVARPLVLGTVLMALLVFVSVNLLSVLRAGQAGQLQYVSGVKGGVYQLARYVVHGRPGELHAADASLAIPAELCRAKRLLDARPAAIATIAAAFEAGGVDRADVWPIVLSYLALHRLPVLAEAMQAWDGSCEEFQGLLALRSRVAPLWLQGVPDDAAQDALLFALDAQDRQLDLAETRYSERLGTASRRLVTVVAVVLSLAAVLLLWRVLRGWHVLLRELERHRRQAAQVVARLAHDASHDELTGLVNRRRFAERVTESLSQALPEGEGPALLYIDLDQFKLINDTEGHGAGDRQLQWVARILAAALGARGVLARLGGDEFGVLLPATNRAGARTVAETLLLALENQPFLLNGRVFQNTASIGVAMVSDAAHDPVAAMAAADAACLVAKDSGRRRVHSFHDQDTLVAERREEMLWVGRVRTALQQDAFVLRAQPIVPLAPPQGAPRRSGMRAGAELLLRLPDEAGDLILPGKFLPAAVRYGLIGEVDRWVIRRAIAEIAEWRRHRLQVGVAEGASDLPSQFSVNLSAISVTDARLPAYVAAELGRQRVEPAWLTFEVTESEVLHSYEAAARVIHALRELGCQVGIDDFGAGESSWPRLLRLPLDFIKVDGELVRHIGEDPVRRAMLEAIHLVARNLQVPLVAEYAESEGVLAVLREIGVEFAQGRAVGAEYALT